MAKMNKISEIYHHASLPDNTIRKMHAIESVPSNLVFKKIFWPFIFMTKLIGVLPLRFFEDGSSSFRYISWPSFYSLIVAALFLLDATCFVPYIISKQVQNLVVKISMIILELSPSVSTFITLISIPWMSPGLASVWNSLQKITDLNCAEGFTEVYITTYGTARKTFGAWVVFTLLYGGLICHTEAGKFSAYMNGKESGLFYWFWILFFSFYTVLTLAHGLHSMMYFSLLCCTHNCFIVLDKRACSESAKAGEGCSKVELYKTLQSYEELTQAVHNLGDTYGLYLAVQVMTMMICTITSIFFIFCFETHEGLSAYIFSVVSYAVWLFWICSSGEYMKRKIEKTQKSLKRACTERNISENVQLEKLHGPPIVISASGYFTVKRELFTSVWGAIVTYLVILLQFKLSVTGYEEQKSERIMTNKTIV